MPKGSVPARAQAIRDAGRAEVTITDMSYDDAVRHAAKMAGGALHQGRGRVVVQGHVEVADRLGLPL